MSQFEVVVLDYANIQNIPDLHFIMSQFEVIINQYPYIINLG